MLKTNCPKVAKFVLILLIAPLVFVAHFTLQKAYAQTSSTINFQGKIVRNDTGYEGLNVTTGSPACVKAGSDECDFQVKYYSASTSGTLYFTETYTDVEIGQYGGIFNLSLGAGTPTTGAYSSLDAMIKEQDSVYVEILFSPAGTSSFTETFSRMPLQASAYAIRSKYSEIASGAFEFENAADYASTTRGLTTPASNGMVYYDTTAGVLKLYSAGVWQDLATGGSSIWGSNSISSYSHYPSQFMETSGIATLSNFGVDATVNRAWVHGASSRTGFSVYSNYSGATDWPLVTFKADASNFGNSILQLTQDGTGNILEGLSGSTPVFNFDKRGDLHLSNNGVNYFEPFAVAPTTGDLYPGSGEGCLYNVAGTLYWDATCNYNGAALSTGSSSRWTDAGSFTYLTSTTDDVLFGGNSTATATFFFDVDASSGNYLAIDNAANTQRLFTIDSNGNVGIGTATPGSKLDIGGANSNITNSTGDITITPNQNLILGSGNFGVGTATPNQKLSVAGTFGIIETGASPTYYTIFQGGDQNGNITYTLPTTSTTGILANNGSGTLSWATLSSLGGVTGTGSGSGTAGQITFWSGTSTITGNNNFWWDNTNQRLGIGTSSPQASLDIAGSTSEIANTSGNITIIPAQYLEIIGSITLQPTVSSTTGVIYKGSSRFIHDFDPPNNGTVNPDGKNLFVGAESGNFTMGSGATASHHASYNTAFGIGTLSQNTIGWSNVAVGHDAVHSNTSGADNSGFGRLALYYNTQGSFNMAIGSNALYRNTIGTDNVAVGYDALRENVARRANVAIGSNALRNADSTNSLAYTNNTAIGFNAVYGSGTPANNTHQDNTGIGANAMYNISSGDYNTALGSGSLYAITTGSSNTVLGYQAGNNITTGSSNIIIGSGVTALAANSASTLNIGNLIYGTGITTGNTPSGGYVGIGTVPSYRLDVAGTIKGSAFIGGQSTSTTTFLAGTSVVDGPWVELFGSNRSSRAGEMSLGTNGSGAFNFFNYTGGNFYNLMTVQSNGNVSISTPSTSVPTLSLGRYSGQPSIKSTADWLIMDSNTSYAAINYFTNQSVILANGGGNVGIKTTPSIHLAIGDSDTGFQWISDGNLAIYSNNVERMRIASNGNITITNRIVQDNWSAPTLQNNWVNYGGGYAPAGYFLDKNCVVHLRGLLRSGTNSTLFTLPLNYRPAYQEIHEVHNGGISRRVDIYANGSVYAAGYTNDYISLDGITFRATGCAGGADLAEHYPSPSSSSINQGDIVSVDPSNPGSIMRSSVSSDSKVIGIISTKPGDTLGQEVTEGPNQTMPVALSGRVPTKVWTKNGPIKFGDYVTSSQLSGFGVKSVRSGAVVGKPLEEFDPVKENRSCISVSSVNNIVWPSDTDGTNSGKPCFKLPDGTYVGKIMVFVNISQNVSMQPTTATKQILAPGWYRVSELRGPDDYAKIKINNTAIGSSQDLILSVDSVNGNNGINVISNFTTGENNISKARINTVNGIKYLEVYLDAVNNNSIKISIENGNNTNWTITNIAKVDNEVGIKEYALEGVLFGVSDAFSVKGDSITTSGTLLTSSLTSNIGNSSNRWNDIYTKGTIRLGSGSSEGGIRYNVEKKRLEFSNDGAIWIEMGDLTSSVVISPEYSGAILYADGTDNYGRMTSDAIETGGVFKNYYEWKSDRETLQDYDILVRITLPTDFVSWKDDAISLDFMTENSASVANNKVDIALMGNSGIDGEVKDGISKLPGSWERVSIKSTNITQCKKAGDSCTVRLSMHSKENYFVRVGDISLNYNRGL